MNFHNLPLITIQHDLPEVIKEIKTGSISAEDIWISCYINDPNPNSTTRKTQSVHGKVRITSHDKNTEEDQNNDNSNDIDHHHLPSLEARDGVECHWANHATTSNLALIISCESLSIKPTLVSFPSQTMEGIQPHGIECMDVAGPWVVTGGKNGNLRLDSWRNFNPDSNLYRIGRGHLSDITSCQFFPSGEVILTTSMDMTGRIYSIDSEAGKPVTAPRLMHNVRTLGAPHGRSIPTAVIIDKGKEIITGCKDGKIRLWNVAQSQVLAEHCLLSSHHSAQILAMKIGKKRFLNRLGEHTAPPPPPPTSSHLKHDSLADHNQFLAVGLSSGALHFAHIPSLEPVKFASNNQIPQFTNSPIDALAISESGELIAYATRSGVVTICTLDWQTTTTTAEQEGEEPEQVLSLQPFTSWTRTESCINSLEFTEDGLQLVVVGDDGLPYRVAVHSYPTILQEFAGFNCDPVHSVRFLHPENLTFLAAKDGAIRIYN